MRCRVSAVSRFGCSHSVPEKKFRQNRFRQKSVTRDCGSKEFSWKVPAPKTNPVKSLPAKIHYTDLRLKGIFVESAGTEKQIRQNRIRQKSGARDCGSKEFSWKVLAAKNKSGKTASGKNPEYGIADQRNFRGKCRYRKKSVYFFMGIDGDQNYF